MLDHHTQQRNISNKTRQQHDSSYVPQNVAFPFCFFSQRRRRWRRRRRRFTAHGVGARPPRLDRREAAGPGARGLRPASQNRRSGQRLLGGACCFLYDSFFYSFPRDWIAFSHPPSQHAIHSFIHSSVVLWVRSIDWFIESIVSALHSQTRSGPVLPSFTGFYRVFIDFTMFDWVFVVFPGFFTEFLPSFNES